MHSNSDSRKYAKYDSDFVNQHLKECHVFEPHPKFENVVIEDDISQAQQASLDKSTNNLIVSMNSFHKSRNTDSLDEK